MLESHFIVEMDFKVEKLQLAFKEHKLKDSEEGSGIDLK